MLSIIIKLIARWLLSSVRALAIKPDDIQREGEKRYKNKA